MISLTILAAVWAAVGFSILMPHLDDHRCLPCLIAMIITCAILGPIVWLILIILIAAMGLGRSVELAAVIAMNIGARVVRVARALITHSYRTKTSDASADTAPRTPGNAAAAPADRAEGHRHAR